MEKTQFAVVECERMKGWRSCLADFSLDGQNLIGVHVRHVNSDVAITISDVESGKIRQKKILPDPVGPGLTAWFSREHSRLALGGFHKTSLLSTPGLAVEASLPFGISAIAWSPNGELLATADRQDNVRVMKAATQRLVAPLKLGQYEYCGQIGFLGDSPEIVHRSNEAIWTWNYKTRRRQKRARMPNLGCWAGSRSADGRTLACVWDTGIAMITDTTTWRSRKVRVPGKLQRCGLSPDGGLLAVGAGNAVVVWDLGEDRRWLTWKKPNYHSVDHLAFSPDGKQLACILDNQVHILDSRTGARDRHVERPKLNAGELRCLRMIGPDDQMDRASGYLESLNPLPRICPVCNRLDLDHVPTPYVLGSGVETPVDHGPAVAGNLLVRESMKRVLDLAAPGLCKFHPAVNRKTKQTTPWLLAVPQHIETTAKPSAKKCPKCREPRNWDDVEATSSPISKHEIFKSRNWWGRQGDERNLYFSVRLETLVKQLGLRGMVRSYDCKQVPTADDLAWVGEKLRLLTEAGSKSQGAVVSDVATGWFKDYLKRDAKKNPVAYDFAAVEKKHGIKLPESYRAFIAKVGPKTFKDIDGKGGFCVHILPPKKLEFEECCEQGEDEEAMFKGLLFATTDHGDAFYFDLSRTASDYEVRKHDHEIGSYEPYAKNFAVCIRRFAGA